MAYEQGYSEQGYTGQAYTGYDNHDDGNGGGSDTNWTYVVTGALFVAAGAYLVFRGVSQQGESGQERYDAYRGTRKRGSGIQVRESITVDKPVEELYSYWRNLENLPRIMSHLESVTTMGNRSHWKAKGPLNIKVEWDATTVEDRPNELISWRSLENAQVPNEGSVRFSRRGANSTEVLVSLTYHPPGGPIGAALAKLFGEEPSQQIRDDLQNFKQAVESGSLSLTSGYGGAGSSMGTGTTAGTSGLGTTGTTTGGTTGTSSLGTAGGSTKDGGSTTVGGTLTDPSLKAEEKKSDKKS